MSSSPLTVVRAPSSNPWTLCAATPLRLESRLGVGSCVATTPRKRETNLPRQPREPAPSH
jgi:hypothetical protein